MQVLPFVHEITIHAVMSIYFFEMAMEEVLIPLYDCKIFPLMV